MSKRANQTSDAETLLRLFVKHTEAMPKNMAERYEQMQDDVVAVVVRSQRRRRLRTSFALRLSLTATVVAAASAAIALWAYRPQPITYVSSGGLTFSGADALAATKASVALAFSEGSLVVMAPSTSISQPITDERGATVGVQRGHLDVNIAHRTKTRWCFLSGPFVVHVTGTAFGLSWKPNEGVFALALKEGSVFVEGPWLRDGLHVEAGKTLRVSLADKQAFVSSAESVAADDSGWPTPAQMQAALMNEVAPAKPPARPANTTPSFGTHWPRTVAQGRFDEVLNDAHRVGTEKVLHLARLDALRAFADAARYKRDLAGAEAAFRAVRKRFPKSGDAADGTFYLGWIKDEQGDEHSALRWFHQYLQDRPQGAYAERAAGRIVLLTAKTSGKAAALPLADAYLVRFPKGAYVPAIRRLRASASTETRLP